MYPLQNKQKEELMQEKKKGMSKHYKRLHKWIKKNYTDWERICGFRYASIDTLEEILAMLKGEGFEEIETLLCCRIYQAVLDEKNYTEIK